MRYAIEVRRALVVGIALLAGCPKLGGKVGPRARADANADATVADTGPPPVLDAAPEDAGPPPIDASDDPRDLHKTNTADLLQLLPYGAETKYMAFSVGPVVGKMSQGNPAIARHTISKKRCLEGLQGVTLQTDEQRRICGADNMVPIYKGGDPSKANELAAMPIWMFHGSDDDSVPVVTSE